MKLCQTLALELNNDIGTWLTGPESTISSSPAYSHLVGPVELTYHPFTLEAVSHGSLSEQEGELADDLAFTWHLELIDDDNQQPLLLLKSENRTLLLLAELLQGIFECAQKVGFIIDKIRPRSKDYALSLSFTIKASTRKKRALGGALILKAAVDSLLFCRGLAMKTSSLSCDSRAESDFVLIKLCLGHALGSGSPS